MPDLRVARWYRIALVALVLTGVVLRLILWLRPRDFWIDEAMLVSAMELDPLSRLVRIHLRFTSVAPPLFMFLEWIGFRTLGPSETALRLPSLLAGLAFLPVAAYFAHRWLPVIAALTVTALAAFSPALIRYSAEVKPYGFEPLVTVLLWHFALAARTAAPTAKAPWVRLGVAGVLAALVTLPTALVLAAIVLAFAVDRDFWSTAAKPIRLMLAVAPGVLVGAIQRLLILNQTDVQSYLNVFWAAQYIGSSPTRLISLHHRWASATLFGGGNGESVGLGLLALGLCLLGGFWVRRRLGNWVAVVVVAPLLLATVASVVNRLPIHYRLVLFLAPSLLFLVGSGLAWLEERGTAGRWLGGLVALGLLALPASDGLRLHFSVANDQPLATLLTDSSYRARVDEPTYLFVRAVPTFVALEARLKVAPREQLAAIAAMGDAAGPNSGNAPSRGRPVVDEGADQHFSVGGQRYLLGVPSGIQYLQGAFPTVPDSGWADNEVRRIEFLGDSCVWLALTVAFFEIPPLLQALEARGWRKSIAMRRYSSGLYRFCRAG